MQAGELRNKIELYTYGKCINEFGEDDEIPVLVRRLKAKIVPANGVIKELQGDSTETEFNHRITIRAGIELTKDMYIMHGNYRHNIVSWRPVYKNERFMEILTRMEV